MKYSGAGLRGAGMPRSAILLANGNCKVKPDFRVHIHGRIVEYLVSRHKAPHVKRSATWIYMSDYRLNTRPATAQHCPHRQPMVVLGLALTVQAPSLTFQSSYHAGLTHPTYALRFCKEDLLRYQGLELHTFSDEQGLLSSAWTLWLMQTLMFFKCLVIRHKYHGISILSSPRSDRTQ